MTTRKELTAAIRERYHQASSVDRGRILDEFVAVTGYHRKHAIRVLADVPPKAPRPLRNRLYDEGVRQALIVLWEASDRVWGKRLKTLIPILVGAMEQHGHLRLDAEIRARLMQVSAATIDRTLAATRASIDGQRKRRTGVGRLSGAAFQFAPLPTGETRRPASSKSTWLNIAAAPRSAATSSIP